MLSSGRTASGRVGLAFGPASPREIRSATLMRNLYLIIAPGRTVDGLGKLFRFCYVFWITALTSRAGLRWIWRRCNNAHTRSSTALARFAATLEGLSGWRPGGRRRGADAAPSRPLLTQQTYVGVIIAEPEAAASGSRLSATGSLCVQASQGQEVRPHGLARQLGTHLVPLRPFWLAQILSFSHRTRNPLPPTGVLDRSLRALRITGSKLFPGRFKLEALSQRVR